jgi:hypothetical protein
LESYLLPDNVGSDILDFADSLQRRYTANMANGTVFTSLFWKDAAERVIWTVAQAFLGFLTAAQVSPLAFNWETALLTAGLAGGAALLKAIVVATALKDETTVSPASSATDSRGSG